MTISERIFQLLNEKGMSQREFSELTGIPQSTISDWKKKGTNPAADKILIICEVLKISPGQILSGVEQAGERGNRTERYIVDRDSELGILIEGYNRMNSSMRSRLMGYVEALIGDNR